MIETTARAEAGVATRTSLTVVVCAYTEERLPLLVESLDALLSQLHATDELIVVIDYNEKLLTTIGERYARRAVVLENRCARGLSGARNTGVAAATRDVVAFVDDDATIAPGWVEAMCRGYGQPQVAGIGGYAQPVWPGRRPGWFPPEFDWVVGCSHLGLPRSAAPVRNFIGCNMSFRRSVLTEAGDFSTAIGRVGNRPVGCEETELCIRISQRDPSTTLMFDPNVVVRHSVSENRVTVKYFLDRCFSEGLSKYKVSGMVGRSDGLSSERDYVLTVLPFGVVRGLVDAVRGGGAVRRAAAGRSLAIVVGCAATVTGYLYAMTHARLGLT
ncbi:glycosyltransferase family 2 protein [Mycobacterium yunnanensis]|uniref:Glycosyltransferase family 2 protein n=1 Tax=Mycobacterium yunnanensis TaxID=368477 RepID=A0A9X3C0R4_9MYCO|nr:glycosyltransferase family 2 protein [Mycobacterium yunnanensis]MCV7420818.1 glycosyltransferase family 2 protein [Mycobacterium yunnanensis]